MTTRLTGARILTREGWRDGHSLIVDPWGTVIAAASRGDGVVVARLRGELLAQVRADLPALTHRRVAGETSVVRQSLPGEAAP